MPEPWKMFSKINIEQCPAPEILPVLAEEIITWFDGHPEFGELRKVVVAAMPRIPPTMSRYDLPFAKTHLSHLVNQALSGEEIVIARGNEPLVKLVPVEQSRQGRKFGVLQGRGRVDDRFFDSFPEEELAAWNGD